MTRPPATPSKYGPWLYALLLACVLVLLFSLVQAVTSRSPEHRDLNDSADKAHPSLTEETK